MTYNFDPEKWYAIRRAVLEQRRTAGELDAAAFERALADLDARFDEMLSRQDADFTLPGKQPDR